MPGLILLGAVAAIALPPIVLPPPSGAPQAIDFARDPLLAFAQHGTAAEPFLAQVGQAVEAHPAVAAAVAASQVSEGVRTEVRAGLFPQIDARVIASRVAARDFGDRTAIVESLAPEKRTDAVLTGSQLLLDFGATGNRIEAADDRVAAARAEVGRVAGETALRAISATYELLGYQSLVDITEASVARRRAILGDVQLRLNQGLGTAGDVARAEAVLADAAAQQARYTRQLERARAEYREAMGVDPPSRLDRSLAPHSSAQSLDAAQAMGRATPAVQAALKRAEAARHEYRAARADGLPRLTAGLDARRYDVFTGSDYEVRGTFVLSQSLFAGGAQRGRIAQAGASSRQAAFIADDVAAQGERDAGAAFTDVSTLTATATALAAAYVANRRVRDTYVEQFRVSRGSLIELLRAEQDYVTAASNYLQGVIELDVARYTLLARTGEILPAIGIRIDARRP